MRDSARKNIITSVPATCIAEFATLPICTLKTTYQNNDNATIRGSFRSIYNNYGIKGFYNASVWAISSQVISTATKYTLYRKLEHSVPNKFIAGGIAGLIGSMMTHPFDVLKIHFQMHSSFISALKQEGPKLFYRGYSKSLTKAVVGSMLFLPLFDILNMRFQTDPHVNPSSKLAIITPFPVMFILCSLGTLTISICFNEFP